MVMFAMSLPIGAQMVLPVSGQVIAAAGAKSEEKQGFFDWLSDALDKNALLETDPILQKTGGEGKSAPGAAVKKGSAPAPQKKKNFWEK